MGFKPVVLHEEYSYSEYPVDTLSFDKIFFECDIAHLLNFRSKRRGIIHNFRMGVDPCYKYIEKNRGGVQWYMIESDDFFSSLSFKLKNENGKLVSLTVKVQHFNCQ